MSLARATALAAFVTAILVVYSVIVTGWFGSIDVGEKLAIAAIVTGIITAAMLAWMLVLAMIRSASRAARDK